jgi:hypothetical protein
MSLSVKRIATSLAILKVNYDEHKDYVDFLVPFFMQALTAFEIGLSLDANDIIAEVYKQFQLKIPYGPARGILTRITRKNSNVVIKDGKNYKLVDHPQSETIDSFRQTSLEIKRRHNEFIKEFRSYLESEASQSLTYQEAEDTLYDFLALDGIAVLQQELEPIVEIIETQSTKKNLYHLAKFIIKVIEHDQTLFEHLEAIAKGSMLADVVYAPDLDNMNRKIKRLDVFLDTTFLLKILGYSDISNQVESAKEILALLKKMKINCYVFPHTIIEIKDILHACKEQLHYNKINFSVWRYFHQQKASRSDLALLIHRIDDLLAQEDIIVKDTPQYNSQIRIDEKEFSDYLAEHFNKGKTLDKDIRSLSAIFRFRRGRSYRDLNDCPGLFITENTDLIKQSNDYFKASGYFSNIPISMNSNSLMTKLWLLAPQSEVNISRSHIIGCCYSLLNPTQEIWQKYSSEAKKLENEGGISQEDIFLMRSCDEVVKILTNECSGDEEEIDKELILFSLEKFKESLTKPLEEEIANLKEQEAAFYSISGELKSKEETLSALTAEKTELEKKNKLDEESLLKLTTENNKLEQENKLNIQALEQLRKENDEKEAKKLKLINRLHKTASIVVSIVIVSMMIYLFNNKIIKWSWLLNHKNSYGIQGGGGLLIIVTVIGLWIKEWRNILFGCILAVGILILSLLGGRFDNSVDTPSTSSTKTKGTTMTNSIIKPTEIEKNVKRK